MNDPLLTMFAVMAAISAVVALYLMIVNFKKRHKGYRYADQYTFALMLFIAAILCLIFALTGNYILDQEFCGIGVIQSWCPTPGVTP